MTRGKSGRDEKGQGRGKSEETKTPETRRQRWRREPVATAPSSRTLRTPTGAEQVQGNDTTCYSKTNRRGRPRENRPGKPNHPHSLSSSYTSFRNDICVTGRKSFVDGEGGDDVSCPMFPRPPGVSIRGPGVGPTAHGVRRGRGPPGLTRWLPLPISGLVVSYTKWNLTVFPVRTLSIGPGWGVNRLLL